MSNQNSPIAALPVAQFVLRTLIILNWMYAVAILALLVVSIANEPWFISALEISGSTEPERLLTAFRAIIVLGLAAVPLHYAVLRRLLAIVNTVRSGDPFVTENALRLRSIGWVLVALNLLSIIIGAIGASVSTKA